MDFNPAPANVMHVDLNSCFASVEQQANPLYRGHPLVVAAYTTDRGCILAASREAKKLGIKTGMRVYEGRALCPQLIVVPSDPPKYRYVHHKLVELLSEYSAQVEVKSIDEMVLRVIPAQAGIGIGVMRVAQEIKKRIKAEIGEWLTVSVGIAPNRYLAKIASNLHKPDGLDIITRENIEEILTGLRLEDLTGIKAGYGGRLRYWGITTPLALYHSSSTTLRRAFGSKIGHDWWLMLHGWETDLFNRDNVKTIGHSYALPTAYATRDPRLHQILCQLVEKMGRRIRKGNYMAQGMHIFCAFADHTYWNHGETLSHQVFSSRDLYKEALRVLLKAPDRPVRNLAVSSFALSDTSHEQLNFLDPVDRKRNLTNALDTIADRWGEFTVTPARMLSMEHKVLDRIAFGQ